MNLNNFSTLVELLLYLKNEKYKYLFQFQTERLIDGKEIEYFILEKAEIIDSFCKAAFEADYYCLIESEEDQKIITDIWFNKDGSMQFLSFVKS
mgnify:CR=1 FL=1